MDGLMDKGCRTIAILIPHYEPLAQVSLKGGQGNQILPSSYV